MKIFVDIESIPQQPEQEAKAIIAETIQPPATMSKAETIDAWHKGEGKYANAKSDLIEAEYRKTSFDASKGQICSVAWAVNDNPVVGTSQAIGENESTMLKMFFDVIGSECGKAEPFFIGHYIGGFDLKFIWQRAVILGIEPPFRLPFRGRHGSDYFCTMTEWCGFKDRISQENLCKALGINGKTDMDGSMVWDAWRNKEFQKVLDYNMEDVTIVREIYKKLTFGR